eukprot:619046-Rhodomonas_salina.1
MPCAVLSEHMRVGVADSRLHLPDRPGSNHTRLQYQPGRSAVRKLSYDTEIRTTGKRVLVHSSGTGHGVAGA